MSTPGPAFPHPRIFWLGCLAIVIGVLSHVPMFVQASAMGYHMAGMPMSAGMAAGMLLIPLGLLLSGYALLPRFTPPGLDGGGVHFHVAEGVPLNREHAKLVCVLLVAVVVDVMKPATIGFVMPGLTAEYAISSQTAGMLALVALTGTAVGSVLWGVMADRSGRRAAILVSALMFIGTSICGAMPSFRWNLLMCFLMGMSAGGLLPISFALLAETIPFRHRGWLLVALGGLGTTGGYLLAAGFAALLEPLFNWRILWMLGLPTGLAIVFLNHYIPESPRFLARNGMKQEARQVLLRFSRIAAASSEGIVEEAETGEKSSWKSVLGAPYEGLTWGLMLAGLAWGLVNFGFLLWLPTSLRNLGMAEQVNALIAQSAVLALPGMALVVWLYHRWSSIHALAASLACSAAALLVFGILDTLEIASPPVISLSTALLLVSSSGVIAMLIPYAAEIYPVHFRGTGAGIVAACSKIGGILGAALGVSGLFDDMAVAALGIALPLLASAALLLAHGIDTRGLRLEEVHRALLDRSRRMPQAENLAASPDN